MAKFVFRLRNVVFSLLAFALSAVPIAFAESYPKAYESVYVTTIEGVGTQETHYMSDGKGHMRSEVAQVDGQKMIVLMDYPNRTMITTMNIGGQKSFMKSPLNEYDGDEDYKNGAKELGAKIIDNRPCHGYETTFKNGEVRQNWIADDTKCLVRSEADSAPKTVTTLKSWVASAPSFSMELPGDYKEYKTPK